LEGYRTRTQRLLIFMQHLSIFEAPILLKRQEVQASIF